MTKSAGDENKYLNFETMLELNHKKLDVWKESIDMVINIYALTARLPKSELYGLNSQMKRAAISIASNISEGSSRVSKRERKRFYEIARSSLVELDTQLVIAQKLNLLGFQDENKFNLKLNVLFAMLTNLIKSTI